MSASAIDSSPLASRSSRRKGWATRLGELSLLSSPARPGRRRGRRCAGRAGTWGLLPSTTGAEVHRLAVGEPIVIDRAHDRLPRTEFAGIDLQAWAGAVPELATGARKQARNGEPDR